MLNDRKIRMGEDPKKRLMATSAITLKSIDAARTAVENLKRQEGGAWQSDFSKWVSRTLEHNIEQQSNRSPYPSLTAPPPSRCSPAAH
jgi:hypothetical protein